MAKPRDRGDGIDDGGAGDKDADVEKKPMKSELAPCLSAGGDYTTCIMPSNVSIPPGTKVTKGDLELFR